MSLILDALRKAEAERQRGAVPGLHAMAPAAGPRPPSPRPWRAWALGAAVAALAVLAVVLWAVPRPAVTPAVAPAAPTAAPPTVPSAATVPPAAKPAAVPDLPVVVSAPPAVPPAAAPPAPVRAPAAAAAASPAAPILTQVRRLAELPPEQRRELPPLVVGGSVWSEQASARFVVLDGQVLREGEAAAPGLVLVKLAPRAATLRWRDTLIEVPF